MGLVNDFKRWVSGEVDDDDFDLDDGHLGHGQHPGPGQQAFGLRHPLLKGLRF